MTTEAVAGAANTEGGEQQAVPESTATPAPTEVKEGTALEAKAEDAKPADDTQVEVVYEFKVPDGMELDVESTDKLKTVAKELKLPADAAQRLVDIAVAREQARVEAHAKQVKDWAAELEADKEVGGANAKETRSLAAKALALAPPEVRTMLEASGLGNYPPLVKWARAIGKALSEDKHIPAEAAVPSFQSRAERMYGKTQPRTQ